MKKLIRKPSKILQQLHRRIDELQNYVEPYQDKKNFTSASSKLKDSFCLINNTVPFQITGFTHNNNTDNETVIGYSFNITEDYFTYPIRSSQIGILVCKNISTISQTYPKSSITCKLFPIIHQNQYILIPILHCFSKFHH